jgi:ATP-dependent Lhr-like helicase
MAGSVLVEGGLKKQIVVDTLMPENPSRFPWGGHLGLQMLQPVIDEIDQYMARRWCSPTRARSRSCGTRT